MFRKKRMLIGIPVVIALLALVFFYSVGAFSGFRVKRELATFANALESCKPFTQDYLVPVLGQTMARSVEGESEDGCIAKFSALGAAAIRCDISRQDLPEITMYFRKQAEATPYFDLSPGMAISYNSGEEMDPLMTLYNSPSCAPEG